MAERQESRKPFPWLLVVLLLVSLAVFFAWPYFDPPQAPVIEFDSGG